MTETTVAKPRLRERGSSARCPVGMLLLLPDLMRQDAWDELWRRLAPLALEIVATTAARPQPEDVARLYETTRQRRQGAGGVDGLWLGQQLFALDMSIPVVVRTTVPGADLSTIIQRWKGSSRPGTRRSGDLREVSPLSSRCLSLFHSPEDVDQLRHDLALFFVGGAAQRAIAGPPERSTSVADLRDLRCYEPPCDDPHPYDVVLRALVRSLTLLAHDCHLVASSGTCAAQNQARRARTALAARQGAELQTAFVHELALIGDAVRQIPPPRLVPMAATGVEVGVAAQLLHDRLDLARVAELLTRPDLYGPRLARFATATLPRNGLALDDWETHRLLTAICTLYGDAQGSGQAHEPNGQRSSWKASRRDSNRCR